MMDGTLNFYFRLNEIKNISIQIHLIKLKIFVDSRYFLEEGKRYLNIAQDGFQYMNYNESGVNIDTGNKFIEKITSLAKQTNTNQVISSIGGFNALYDISNINVKNPVLVSSTDGVGTKLKLALQFNQLNTIGIDLVAMCVNDIIVSGANPLFFLDYYATGKLDLDSSYTIINSIIEGCKQAEMSLIGGETAEMPILYHNDDFDLAGFCVGIVDREKIINPNLIKENDIIIGIASSGPHSNGYSLIHKIFDFNQINKEIVDQLLMPTKIYVQAIKSLTAQINVHGIAHITGGGITENLPRILPYGVNAIIELANNTWNIPPIFNIIKHTGSIDGAEMLRVFNCGVGMIVIVDKTDVNDAISIIEQNNERAFVIGEVVKSDNNPCVKYSQ